MTLFWLMAAGLILLSYALFWWSLHRQSSAADADTQIAAILDAHRQRRRELEQELAEEKIDREQFDQLIAELNRDLLDLTPDTSETDPAKHLQGLLPIFATLAVLPLVGLSLYFAVGRPDLIGQAHASRIAEATQAPKHAKSGSGTTGQKSAPPSLETGIQRLQERLQANPDSLDDWVLLGRTYIATNQMEKALETFRHAMELAPDNPDVKLFYAEALARSQGEKFSGEPEKLILSILKQSPNQPHALWLAGLAALQQNQPAKAEPYWQRLLAQLPPTSEKRQQLAMMMEKVGMNVATAVDTPTKPQAAAGAIQVTVSLSSKLASQAGPEDVVYIFARAAHGPPMPLAIVRKRVKDLPVTVTLDDTQAMMPQMKLSNFDRVVIGARVAKSGNAKGSPGDLEGLSQPIAIDQKKKITLVINRIRS